MAVEPVMRSLPGHVPTVLAGLPSLGGLPLTNRLHLAIGLPLRNQAALDAFLRQVYDPTSPHYRQYLTPDQFTAQFGPTKQDYQKVIAFAQTNGLTVAATHGNRLLLDVTGPVAAVEQSFHIKLHTYRHPNGARDFYAPDTEPEVAADLPVADVQGLSDYLRPQPKIRRMAGLPVAKVVSKSGSAPDGSGAYFGDDFRTAYLPGTTLTGVGQQVGLLEFDGFYASDIANYAAAAGGGRASIPVQTVLLDGYNGKPTSDGNPEVALDIQMAMAMAPGLSKIIVFSGGPNGAQNDILNVMAASNSVKNLACCWGWGGGPSTTTDAIFKQMAAQGQSFFNASGDSDAFTTGANSVNGVDRTSLANAPSSSPYITQVGGTTLTTGSSGAWQSETVWNWGGGSGSSGGISSYYSIPAWQTNVSMVANQGLTTKRNIPDVAMVADNVYCVSDDGQPGEVGGTSCAAPLWAGMAALANQQAVAAGAAPVGFINPAVYAIGAGADYGQDFHDTTTGNNTWSSSRTQFYAVPGYDLCTGWGTPAGTSFIDDLIAQGNSLADALVIRSGSALDASGVVGGPFVSPACVITLTNSGAAPLTWKLVNSNAVPWLQASPVGGTLASHATNQVVFNFTAKAAKLAVGNYSASFNFSNLTSTVMQTVTFGLQVLPVLSVEPATGFTATGPIGGPFSPATMDYTISNLGGTSAVWKVVESSKWLTVNQPTGTIGVAGQGSFTLNITTNANSLKVGVYKTTVTVRNQKNQTFQKLPIILSIGQNIISNGGFETGDFTGWKLSATNTQVGKLSGLVHSGHYGAELGNPSSLGSLSQTAATTAGQTYLLSLWMDNPNNPLGATPNEFKVQWEGTTLYDNANIPFTKWTNLQFVVTATNSGSLLEFEFRDDPYYLGLDDVSLKPIPSPKVLAVAAAPASAPTGSGFKLVSAAPVRKFLPDRMTGIVSRLVPQGRLPATNLLHLTIGLPLRNQPQLDELIRQLYDPAGTNYHRYLTPSELTARFGPTEDDYAAVRQFAESNGLVVTREHPNRMVLDVVGNAADVDRAFQLNLYSYRHPTEPRDFFAPDSEPSVPAVLKIVSVEGLSDFYRPRPAEIKRNVLTQRSMSFSGTGPNQEYMGNDFRNAYVPGTTLNGAGQTVALLEYSDYYKMDITNYQNAVGVAMGITNYVPLTNVVVGGSVPGTDNNDEVALDIEMAIAMAPKLSRVIVYEQSASSSSVLSQIQSDNLAKQVSSSWSIGPWSSSTATTWDNILKLMAAQGQSYFQSSGDSDSYTGDQLLDSGTTVPMDSPYATIVGGTTLTMSSHGVAWSSETVWNYNNVPPPNTITNEGSGGGVSTYYSIPSWQTNANVADNGGSTAYRNIPDVALTADNIYVCYDNGDSSGTDYFMGTSAAAPLWAGFTALVNQQATATGDGPVGFLNPALYASATNASYSSLFHDITTGNNIGTNSTTLYSAGTGYDLCTGLGSPNGTSLINALAPPMKPYFITQPAGQNATNGANVVFNVNAGGAAPLNYQWLFNSANLTDGGNVSGGASSILTLAAVTAANAGNYSLIVSNSYGAITSSVAILNIGSAPVITAQPSSLAVPNGSNAVFSAAASGSTNLVYKWFKNGLAVANGAGVSGASSNVLTLIAVTTNSAGNYNLSVTNVYGAAASSPATLTVLVPPIITGAGWSLLAESATPTNGAIDPGETVTVGFTLQNQGTISTTNLVATLLAGTNILAPGGPQTYGAIAGYNGTASMSYTFTAAGVCGSNLAATLQLQDGANNLGAVVFSLPLGQLVSSTTFVQNFDSVSAPALPSGWSTVNITGTDNNWAATAAAADSAPNSAFISDLASTSENALVSPVIPILSATAQLSFRHDFSFDVRTSPGTSYRDGGVLEVQIGSGGFADIVSAGGSFVTGGYNGSISTTQNPLGRRSAWIGSSSGWQTVTVNLPPSAAGQNIQLRWNCGTDSANYSSPTGWYVDSISISDAAPSCLSVFTDLAAGQSLAPGSLQAGQNLVYTLTVTNLGPQAAANVILTDTVPANVTFGSASPGYAYSAGQVVWSVGMLPAAAATNFTLTLAPVAGNVFTNLLSVGTVTPEISTANNTVSLVSTLTVNNLPPVISSLAPGLNGSFNLNFAGTPGSTYVLEATTNLLPPGNWLPLATNTMGTNGVWQFTDTSASNNPMQFYRLQLAP